MMSSFHQRDIAAKLYQNEVERINEAHDTAIEQASTPDKANALFLFFVSSGLVIQR